MKRRLVILTEIIAPYRVPVFNALARRPEIDPHVIFLAETDSTLRQWEVPKEQIQFSYEVLPSWRKRFGSHSLLVNSGLGRALRKAAPEAIVCGGYNYPASWRALWWARRRKVRFLVWVESTQMDQRGGRPLIESLKKRFIQGCDAFVVPGKSSFDYVRSFHVPADTIFTAPNAVDTDFFATQAETIRRDQAAHRQALGLPRRYFLAVGRLVPEKGVFDLLEAYGGLPSEVRAEIGLVFVGDGIARPELERRARELAPAAICFPGFAQREQLAQYYALADAFVFPTHSDPWGLVVNEAMACGLPIFCTDLAGCAADLVKDGWNGRIVPAKDPGRLGSTMREMVERPDLTRSMGKNSRELIGEYSPQACAAGIARSAFPLGGPLHG